jgi:hypothetical protein
VCGSRVAAESQRYPDDSLQSIVGTWWVEDQGRDVARGRLLRAFVPHVDQQPLTLIPIGRSEPTEHHAATVRLEPLHVPAPRRAPQLPVAALPQFAGEVRTVFRAKVRPVVVLGTGGPDGEMQPGALPDGFTPSEPASQRALQILVARCLEEGCRTGIAAIQDKRERGSLRKGAYYLARIIYQKQRNKIDGVITKASPKERKADIARKAIEVMSGIVKTCFDDARETFEKAMQDYLAEEGGNEDAALKNSDSAQRVDKLAKP